MIDSAQSHIILSEAEGPRLFVRHATRGKINALGIGISNQSKLIASTLLLQLMLPNDCAPNIVCDLIVHQHGHVVFLAYPKTRLFRCS